MALNVFPFELVVKLPSDIHDKLETKVKKNVLQTQFL